MTVGCLVAALSGVDFRAVRESFSRADYSLLPVLLLALFAYFYLKAIRWTLLLQPLRRLRVREVFPPMMIGFMGNNVLPAHLGEFMRVFVLGRQTGLSKTAIFTSVVLERVFDVATILAFLGGSLLFVEGLPDSYRTTNLIMAGVTAVGILVLLAYVCWTAWFVRMAEAILGRLSFLPESLRTTLAEMLESGADGLGSLRSARLATGIVVTSIAQWFLMGVMVYVALWSFDMRPSLAAAFVVVGVTAVGVTVPSSPGFFGVIQLCFWVSLSIFGYAKADVFAASVYYHLAQYIPVTLLGLYYVSKLGIGFSDLRKEAEAEGEQPHQEEDKPLPAEAFSEDMSQPVSR